MDTRTTERAVLEATVERSAAAASEVAEQIYEAVEAERADHRKKIRRLQYQLAAVAGASERAAGSSTGDLDVDAAVIATVEQLTRTAHQTTEEAMRIAGDENLSSAVTAVTPRDSEQARLAAGEAQLEEAAAEAVKELRYICQAETLAERTLVCQLEQQLQHAHASAAAAALNAENMRLKELGEASERLENVQDKEAELQGLLRSSRKEFVALEEKLKVALQDSAAALMAEEQLWRVKLAKAVEAAVVDAQDKADTRASEAVAELEAEAEAKSELAVMETMLEAEADKEAAVAAAVADALAEANEATEATSLALKVARQEVAEAAEQKLLLTPRDSATSRFAAREKELLAEAATATAAAVQAAVQDAEVTAEAAFARMANELNEQQSIHARELELLQKAIAEEKATLTPRETARAKLANAGARESELLEQLEDLQEEMRFVQSSGTELEERLGVREAQMSELESELSTAKAEAQAAQAKTNEVEREAANAVAAAKAWGQERVDATEQKAKRSFEQLVVSEAKADTIADQLESLQVKCALRFSSRILVPVVRSWADWAQHVTRQKRHLLQSFSRRQVRSTCCAYYTWLEVCTEMRRQRILLKRCVRRLVTGLLQDAWLRWRELLHEARTQRKLGTHKKAVNDLESELHAERRKHLAPRTHLHCRTCSCEPTTRTERHHARLKAQSHAAAAAGITHMPWAGLSDSPGNRSDRSTPPGSPNGITGNAHARSPLRASTDSDPSGGREEAEWSAKWQAPDNPPELAGQSDPIDGADHTPPSSPSRYSVTSSVSSAPSGGGGRVGAAGTVKEISPARSNRSSRSQRLQGRSIHTMGGGEDRGPYMKF